MPFLWDLLATYPVLSAVQTAFMLWMLVDAYRRQAEVFWFWIILIVQFFGAWAYFFVVYLPSQRFGSGLNFAAWFQPRVSLDELTYRAEQMPTLTNHLALAQRLMEVGRHADAVPHLEAALKTEPEHPSCLFALAHCRKELGAPEEAAAIAERILARDPRWSNYSGWRLLIATRLQVGDPAGALDACRELARLSPTLENHCLLAEHLIDQGQAAEAKSVLERTLRDHDFAPSAIRSRNRRWARQARRLLGAL